VNRKREIAHPEAPRYVWLGVLGPFVIIVTSPRYIWGRSATGKIGGESAGLTALSNFIKHPLARTRRVKLGAVSKCGRNATVFATPFQPPMIFERQAVIRAQAHSQ
jgi:hypothetical protein